MEAIPRKYIINESNERVAVQLDIRTFEKIEQAIEDYALVVILDQEKGGEPLDITSAKAYYRSLKA